MSIIAYPLEATEYTAEDVQSYLSTRTSGVYSEDITFTPEGMTVTVSPFLAWFNYAKFKGCSVAVTEPEILTFSPAHAVLDRIDRIALRVDFTLNRAYFTIVEGIPSSTPIPSEISKTEVINDISPVYVRIRAGATEITPADITSTILDESVCGIMRDGVTGIPTAQLQAQAEKLILRLHEAISEVQSGSAFMIGSLYDPENKAKPVAFDDEVIKRNDKNIEFYEDLVYFLNKRTFIGSSETVSKLAAVVAENIFRALVIHKTTDLEKSVYFQDVTETYNKVYQIFGEHNKPLGTYTGTGETSRTINIGGIGKILILYNNTASYIGFVTQYGIYVIQDGLCGYIKTAKYKDGLLTINGTAEINDEGKTISYQVI